MRPDAEVVLPEGSAILARVALAKDALYVVLRDAGVAASSASSST